MIAGLPDNIDDIKGFLAVDEAVALYRSAIDALPLGPVLEIGSYCGKSTIYLGLAAGEVSRDAYVAWINSRLRAKESRPKRRRHKRRRPK